MSAAGEAAAPGAPRSGPTRLLLPLGLAVGAVGLALLVQQVFDPFRIDIPLCPVHALTGLHCPGCGAIRCVHALLDGNLLLALRSNVLIVSAIPAVGVGLVVWAARRLQGRTLPLPPPAVVVGLAVVAGIFAILRNLPAFWFLAPISLVGA